MPIEAVVAFATAAWSVPRYTSCWAAFSPGSQYTLKPKQDGQGVVPENMPQGKKLKDTDSNRVLTALTDLRFTDVQKKSSTSQELKPHGERRDAV